MNQNSMGQSSMQLQISIIIPVYNEMKHLPQLAKQLEPWHAHSHCELIFVDGGSDDGSALWLQQAGYRLISSNKGRALQMNAGAKVASSPLLLFLHADTQLPNINLLEIMPWLIKSKKVWGRFNVYIEGRHWMFKVIAFCINWRSQISGIATGDQVIFVRQQTFNDLGGFAEQALMEDIALSSRLLTLSRPLCIKQKVHTSGRRWETFGIFRTILLMWQLRFDYWRGVPADELAKRYR